LEIGKQADLVAIDLSTTSNTPDHDPLAAIIFSAAASDVSYTVTAGQVLFDGQRVRTLDEEDLKARVDKASVSCSLESDASPAQSVVIPAERGGPETLCLEIRALAEDRCEYA